MVFIVHVHVKVKENDIEAFKEATLKNARNSLKEAGVIRFDVIQQLDDPKAFILSEVYKNADAAARHKETAHYLEWRDTVELFMAEPRYGIKYMDIFPGEKNW